jgi:hypothetical protein
MTKTDFLKVLRDNVATTRAAYNASDSAGYVYVWSDYSLGVKFSKDVCHAVSIDLATVTNRRNLTFTNGHGKRAICMNRQEALRGALTHAVEMLENFEANMAE